MEWNWQDIVFAIIIIYYYYKLEQVFKDVENLKLTVSRLEKESYKREYSK